MNLYKYYRAYILKNLGEIKVLIFLGITTWIAHFWYYASFGLYEDDHVRVSSAMNWAGRQVLNSVLNQLLMRYGQGRPLHDSLIWLFSYLGNKLGGLHVIYWFGYFILIINVFLFYFLLKRLWHQPVFTVTGALAFSLFPADTTRVFLTHALGIQPSITFLLVAFHCYLSGRRKLSYFVILGSLLCYETIFPVFLVAPLLKQKWDSKLIGKTLKHALTLGVMIIAVVIVRKFRLQGFGVIADPSSQDIMQGLGDLIIGPIVSMATFLYRPVQSLFFLNGERLIFLSLYFIGIVWLLLSLKLDISSNELHLMTSRRSQPFHLAIPEFLKPITKLILLGLTMLSLAYPLTLTTSGTIIGGKGSRVHSAAVVGASILFACLCSVIWFIAKVYRKKRLAIIGLAGFFTLLVGFGLIVQKDYQTSWNEQKTFWTDVVRLCPDIDEGTVILVEGISPSSTRVSVRPYFSSLTLVLNKIYDFSNWKKESQPELLILKSDWQNKIITNRNLFQLSDSNAYLPCCNFGKRDYPFIVDSSKVILLEMKDGKLIRRNRPLIISEQEFKLKQSSTRKIPPLKKTRVYDFLG